MNQTGVFPVNSDQQPTPMASELDDDNCTGNQQLWQQRARNYQEKHTLEPLKTPERSRKSHRELWQATSMTKKPTWQAETYWGVLDLLRLTGIRWKQQPNKKPLRNTKNNNQDQWRMVRNHHWSSVDNNKNRCQPPRSTKLGCRSDLDFRSNLCLQVGSATPMTTTTAATSNNNETTTNNSKTHQEQLTTASTNNNQQPPTTTINSNHQQHHTLIWRLHKQPTTNNWEQ